MEPPSYDYGPGPADEPPPATAPADAAPRARTGLIVLIALLSQLVIIAAACNQWVTVRVADSIGSENSQFARDAKASLLTYNWRFAPLSSDHQHIWLAQMLLILTTLAVSAILIATLVRGPVTFDRAFFGTWMAVVVATMVGAYSRGLVNDAFNGSRVTRAVFGPLGPNSITFFGAVVLGFVVAVVTAIVAVSTRRPAAAVVAAPSGPATYVPPDQPPPYYGEPSGPPFPGGPAMPSRPPWQDQRYGPPGRHAAPAAEPSTGGAASSTTPTTQVPSIASGAPSAPTTRIPDPGPPTGPIRESSGGDQPTTQFPRPPDDEEFGHDEPEPPRRG